MDNNLQVVEKVREMIKIGNAAEAEKSLEAYANSHGDEAVAIIISQLTPAEMRELFNAHDAGKPTLAFDLASPEAIFKTLEIEGAFWTDRALNEPVETQKLVLSKIGDVLNSCDSDKWPDIFNALASSDQGLLFLTLPFIGTEDDEEEVQLIRVIESVSDLWNALVQNAPGVARKVSWLLEGNSDIIADISELRAESLALLTPEKTIGKDEMFLPLK